ncbi:MAG: type II toxin-antitoxin system VapC family toxin [Campylobacteraceae bacterium]|nr:type II toxin-antitoxin system VapC family toxin [Campylobacteraceae bacterium]
MKIFLDTNILLDLLLSGRHNSINSQKAVLNYSDEGYKFVVSGLSLATIFFIGAERSKKWLETKEFIKAIHINRDIWEIYDLSTSDRNWIFSYMDENYGSDYEDLEQYICAKNSGSKAIITNDKNFPNIDIPLIRTDPNLQNHQPNLPRA